MSYISRLTGTPWHTEKMTRAEGDDRRHRSRCIYYQKKDRYCSYALTTCGGTAHCDYYQEHLPEEPKGDATDTKKQPIETQKGQVTDVQLEQLFPINSKVKHLKIGTGTVTKIQNGKITIVFDNGKKAEYSAAFLTKKMSC